MVQYEKFDDDDGYSDADPDFDLLTDHNSYLEQELEEVEIFLIMMK